MNIIIFALVICFVAGFIVALIARLNAPQEQIIDNGKMYQRDTFSNKSWREDSCDYRFH